MGQAHWGYVEDEFIRSMLLCLTTACQAPISCLPLRRLAESFPALIPPFNSAWESRTSFVSNAQVNLSLSVSEIPGHSLGSWSFEIL